jgi:hypothetical protein
LQLPEQVMTLPPESKSHWQLDCGSVQSVYSVPLPEQQDLGSWTSVAGPTQVHRSPLHIAERHSTALLHDPPLAT